MALRKWLWLVPGVLWAVFTLWYTNLGGALSAPEIETYMARLEARGADAERLREMRRFMEADDGRQFIMVNLLHMANPAPVLPATGPDAAASDLIDHYMEYMYPALFARASHPVFLGRVEALALDLAGIEGAARWDQVALMRYRSRRDMLAISTDPRFGERHEYKLAALAKTIAVPTAAIVYLSDPRVLFVVFGFALIALVDLIVFRRK